MAISFPLTFSLAPFATGQALNAEAYGQQLVANLQASISGDFLTGQIGGTQPTQDVGPWLNGDQWYFWDPIADMYVAQSLASSFPTGSMLMFGGLTAPTGFLLCDGSLYLQSAQLPLFNVIGRTYGIGDGVSTFGVPDFRARTAIGRYNGTGGAAGLTLKNLGGNFGEETHLLATTELASHNHIQNAHAHTDSGHTHPYISSTTIFTAPNSGSGAFAYIPTGASTNTGNAVITASTAVNQAAGGGVAHNNIQPGLVVNYIIKT